MSLSKVQFEREVNSCIRKFTDELKAPEEYYDKGIYLCERVRKSLEQEVSRRHVNFSIASTFYSGSIGKHIDVRTPDFDVVMKINNRLPPFRDVIQFFENHLQQNAQQLEIDSRTFKVTVYSIQFSFVNGMKMDLVPAVANLTDDEIYRKMKLEPKNRRFFSSSLGENQVEFMKQQDSFAHAVARLAKLWFKSMDFGGAYIAGGSMMFELLAVAAVLQEKQAQSAAESMLGAFRQVIDSVENMDRLTLSFEKNYYGWRVHTSRVHGLGIPHLIEPTNRYNNFLKGMKPQVLSTFKNNGRMMRYRIDSLMERQEFIKRADAYGVVIDFDKLFETVPV